MSSCPACPGGGFRRPPYVDAACISCLIPSPPFSPLCVRAPSRVYARVLHFAGAARQPVLQMPSQICRKLLRSGRASLEAPGKEGLGKSATRVRQMLYRLVQEHCRASGEEQDLAREGGDGWQGVPDRLRGRLRGSRQEPELATAGGGVGSAGEVASSAAASPARLTIDGAEEGRGRGQITGIRGVGAGLDEGGESRGSEGMGQGSRGAEDGARQGVGGGSTRDDWLSLQHMGLQTRYRVISTGIGHGGHLGPSPARVVSKGDTVTVHATGRLDATGATFWSTRDAGHAPFTFRAGVGGFRSCLRASG